MDAGIDPYVANFFKFEVLNFPFHIWFSKLLKFKTLWDYFGVDFFDLCSAVMIMK